MRSTNSSVIILTLTMFLLLFMAIIVFLLQGRQQLQSQGSALATSVAGLEVTREQLTLAFQSAESARLATDQQLATAVAEKLALEGQLVDSDQQVNELEATVAGLNSDLVAANATRTLAEAAITQAANQPPVLRIVSPEEGALLLVDTAVPLLFSVADPAGVVSVTLRINDQPIHQHELDALTLYTADESWTPTEVGTVQISLVAVNTYGRVAEPVTVSVRVVSELAQVEPLTTAVPSDVQARIAQQVAELRGIPGQTAVAMDWVSSEQLQTYVANDLLADYTPELAETERLVYAAFDLLPTDFDLHAFRHQLYNEQIDGFYDPEGNRFYLVGDVGSFDTAAELIYVHEYVHVLQHQQFDLSQLDANGRDADGRLALLALVEGEAALVEQLYRQQGYLAIDPLVANVRSKPSPVLESAPPVLAQTLLFPYEDGLQFAQMVYNQSGVAGLDAVWQAVPQSTEQILHPERYLSGDTPQLVSLPSLTDTLGGTWELVAEDVWGEFRLRLYLAGQLNEAQVETAATGWGGDRFAVYQQAQGQLALVWTLVWDTDADATEFAALYPQYARGLLQTDGQLQGQNGECWQGENDVICLVQHGRYTTITRAPEMTTAVVLSTQLSQRPLP